MLLPLEVDSVVSNSLNIPEHRKQLLDIVSAKACIVIPAWRLAQTWTGTDQPANLKLGMGESSEVMLCGVLCRLLCCAEPCCGVACWSVLCSLVLGYA